jgi:hypothetical protein
MRPANGALVHALPETVIGFATPLVFGRENLAPRQRVTEPLPP